MKNIFITGTTGFLGSYFLYHVLQHSEDNIICLARDTPMLSASRRVIQQLYKIHQTYCKLEIGDNDLESKIQKRLQIVSGDITSTNLGLTKQFERGSIHELWHIAANVQFGDSAKEEIIQVNLEGGKNVVQFAKQNGIEIVNYISTAYVAGQKTGPVNETENFDVFPSNNIYEESKRLMEKEIISANKNNILSFRIFRPSIIAGHSKTYEPDFSNGGLYGFLALTNSLKKSFEINHPGYFKKNLIKLYANRFSTLNIVPVDQVVKTLFDTATCPDSLNKIFHVVSENNTTLNEVALLINLQDYNLTL
jgi:nucleoside-diphosphate-sugar epimerase